MRNSTIDKESRVKRTRSRIETQKASFKSGKSSKGKTVANVFTVLFGLGTIGIIVVIFLLYGPYSKFRSWLVTTAMTTMTHQYFATWFYDDDTINYILDKNKVVETNETTDVDAIKIGASQEVTEYENEYERAILERDSKNNDYKIIEISEKSFDGYLVAVYDPSRIQAVCTENLGKSGQYLTKMAKNNDALIAINGGGFNDPNFNSTGGQPLGITVCNGTFKTTIKSSYVSK